MILGQVLDYNQEEACSADELRSAEGGGLCCGVCGLKKDTSREGERLKRLENALGI